MDGEKSVANGKVETGNSKLERTANLANDANGDGVTVLANIGWTDVARAASLAVRRAKAQARGPERDDRGRGGAKGGGGEYNPHWPVYRRPIMQPPGGVKLPPEGWRPLPGPPVPRYKTFRRENVDKFRRGEGR